MDGQSSGAFVPYANVVRSRCQRPCITCFDRRDGEAADVEGCATARCAKCKSPIRADKRFAAWLKRSPDTATADDIRRFQLHLIESGASICNRNRIGTGLEFLLKVTLRRHDLAAEIYHLNEPKTVPQVLAPEEVRRILNCATSS